LFDIPDGQSVIVPHARLQQARMAALEYVYVYCADTAERRERNRPRRFCPKRMMEARNEPSPALSATSFRFLPFPSVSE